MRLMGRRDYSSNERGIWISLVVQWLGLHTAKVGGTGSIPGWETKIPHAKQCGQRV